MNSPNRRLCLRSLCIFPLIVLGRSEPGEAAAPQALVFLPGDAVVAPAAGRQFNPEIAAGGGGYLAVWVDARTAMTDIASFSGGPNFDHHIGSMWDVYAARFDADGHLLDETPIIVGQQIQNQGMPDVAWNGENWLVVWSGAVGMQCCPDVHIFGARISAEGLVLDAKPILIDSDATGSGLYYPCVASDGNSWVVVWRDLDEVAGIFTLDGTRIAPTGTVLDPGGIRLRRDTFNSYPMDPDLVFAADEYLLVWTENMGRVAGQRLTPNLAQIGGVFTVNAYTPSEGYNPRAATNGTDFFVTWWEDRYDYWSQLAGARVSHAGVVLDPSGIFLTEAYGTTNYEPAVDWDGVNYVVVYGKDNTSLIDLFATRVTFRGVVLDYGSQALRISTASQQQGEAAIAHRSGGGSLIVWSDSRYSVDAFDGAIDIFGATFAPNGAVGAESCATLGAPRQSHLRLIPNASGCLAVFRSETSPETRILVQRIDSGGGALDPEPILIAKGTSALQNPSAAWSGSEYLVVWEDARTNQILGRRLAPDLTFLDTSPIALLPGNTPDVAAVNGAFLVVTSYEQPHEIRQIYSQRVRGSDGAILDSTPRLVGYDFSLYPRVAAFGSKWMVVWERHPTHDDPFSTIRASLVAADGVPAPEFTASDKGELPAVAAGSDQALIAWQSASSGSSGLEILASRWLPDGTRLGPYPIAVTMAANSQFDVGIASTGDGFVAAFGDFRNDDELESHRGDLSGARIDLDGTVLDPDGFAVATDSIPEMFPHVAAKGSQIIAGGSVFRQDSGYAAYRIALRPASSPVSVLPDEVRQEKPLLLSFPNPALMRADIILNAKQDGRISVMVYDLAGRIVRRLFEGSVSAGEVHLKWDLRDTRKQVVPPGVYLLSADTGGVTSTTRIVVAR